MLIDCFLLYTIHAGLGPQVRDAAQELTSAAILKG